MNDNRNQKKEGKSKGATTIDLDKIPGKPKNLKDKKIDADSIKSAKDVDHNLYNATNEITNRATNPEA